MRRFSLAVIVLALLSFATRAQQVPQLAFTDIVSGANSGGEGGNGVYVSLFGKGFGATQGTSTVTVNGAPPAAVKSWCAKCSKNTLLDMIVIQLGPANASGPIVVTVGGQASNTAPFTVVAGGKICFIAPTGSDSAAGSFTAPWKTPAKAKSVGAGATVYIRAGTYTSQDDNGATILCNGACDGSAGAYWNLVGYPGEYPTLGGSGLVRGIYHWGTSVWQYATIANLALRGTDYGLTAQNVESANGVSGAANFIRLVNLDARSLNGGSTAIDFEMPVNTLAIYGVESGQNGVNGATFDNRAYSLYMGGYGLQTNIDIGWNRLHDNAFGKGIQIYGHIAKDKISDLKIHDNQIYNNTMTGMALGGSDGNTDFVNDADVFNNEIFNNETGAPADHGIFGGLELNGLDSQDGTYQIHNNTFYGNAPAHSGISVGGEVAFATAGVKLANFVNNIFYAAPGSAPSGFGRCYFYFDDQSPASASRVTFSNNVYFNAGNGPSGCNYNVGKIVVGSDAGAINADPQFVAASSGNFHLQQTSPAVGAGNTTQQNFYDFDGLLRPTPPSIGAFEFAAGTGTNPPPVTTVTSVKVTCTPASITLGTASQCVAVVNGTNVPPQTVTWKTSNGVISAAGKLVPNAAVVVTVTATSTFDTTKSGTATVTVNGATPPPPPMLAMTCIYAKAAKTTTCKITGTNTGVLNVTATETGGTISSTVAIP